MPQDCGENDPGRCLSHCSPWTGSISIGWLDAKLVASPDLLNHSSEVGVQQSAFGQALQGIPMQLKFENHWRRRGFLSLCTDDI